MSSTGNLIVDSGNYANFNTAIANIGGKTATLVIKGRATMSADLTIPSTLTIVLKQKATIDQGRYSLKVSGQFRAELYQVFLGSGTVLFDKRQEVFPEWWGAEGNGFTDDTKAIQAAIDSSAKLVSFQAREYVVTSLRVVSNQMLVGKGIKKSLITWPQKNLDPAALNMFNSTDDLINWKLEGVSLRGTLMAQTSEDRGGQNLAALKFRSGSLQNIQVKDCCFYEFGLKNNSSGGGVIFGPTKGQNKVVSSITFSGCEFRNIANVPGLYINANDKHCITAKDIEIINCKFINRSTYSRQNFIYLLTSQNTGNTLLPFNNVTITGNTFEVDKGIDAGVELNDCSNFIVSRNQINIAHSADATGILIRANCSNGEISRNKLINSGQGCIATAGIAVVSFSKFDTSHHIQIADNSIKDFKAIGIQVSSTKKISVQNNQIHGKTHRLNAAIRLSASEDFSVINNTITHASYGLVLTTGIKRGEISNCVFSDVGVPGDAIISTELPNQDISNVAVKNNTVTNAVTGTLFFYSPAFLTSTGNTLSRNSLPHGLLPVNPSYADFVSNLDLKL